MSFSVITLVSVLLAFRGTSAVTVPRVRQTKQADQIVAQEFFDFNKCVESLPRLMNESLLGMEACGHTFSCNNFWHVEVMMEVYDESFCMLNAYERNTPMALQAAMTTEHRRFLHNVVAPMWDIIMQTVPFPDPKDDPTKVVVGLNERAGNHDCMAPEDWSEKFACMANSFKKPSSNDIQKVDSEKRAELIEKLRQGLEKQGMMLSRTSSEAAVMAPTGPVDAATLEEKLKLGPEWDDELDNPESAVVPGQTRYDTVQPGLLLKGFYLTDIEPLARCNDGTSAISYFKEGTDKDKFHLHLSGGYFCYNARNCRKRCKTSPMMCSTKGYEMEAEVSGVFDPVHGGMPGYTHGMLSYCSSDAYFGQYDHKGFSVFKNTYIKKGQKGTPFRGFTMVNAMFTKYVEMGLGSKPDQELVVSGCSAGSIAVTAQADSFGPRVCEMFKKKFGDKKCYEPKVVVVADNAPIVSPEPIIRNFNGELSLFGQSQELAKLLYVQSGISADFLSHNDCVSKGHPDAPTSCVFPEQAQKWIKAPNMIMNNLFDTFILFNPAGVFKPTKKSENDFMRYAVKAQYDQLMVPSVAGTQNMFGIACNDHCMSTHPLWWRLAPVSAKGELWKLSSRDIFDLTRAGKFGYLAVDECKEFNCGCINQATFYDYSSQDQYQTQKSARESAGLGVVVPNATAR